VALAGVDALIAPRATVAILPGVARRPCSDASTGSTLRRGQNRDRGVYPGPGRRREPQEPGSARRTVGLVFQDFQLFSHLSVLDTVALAQCRRRAERRDGGARARATRARGSSIEPAPSSLSSGAEAAFRGRQSAALRRACSSWTSPRAPWTANRRRSRRDDPRIDMRQRDPRPRIISTNWQGAWPIVLHLEHGVRRRCSRAPIRRAPRIEPFRPASQPFSRGGRGCRRGRLVYDGTPPTVEQSEC
jgi:hypothetical protein